MLSLTPARSMRRWARMPTPNELYRAAVMIEDAAIVAGILSVASIGEREISSVMNFFSDALMAASQTLTTGLDENGGTFSNLMKIEKAS